MLRSDAVRRTIRTFLQAFIGLFIVFLIGFADEVLNWASTGGDFPSMAVLGRAAVAGVFAGVVAVITLVQTLLEDNTKMPALLKAPSSSGLNPVPESDDIT